MPQKQMYTTRLMNLTSINTACMQV